MMPNGIVAYGGHPEQHFVLTPPASSAPETLGTVALLHGGYWRAEFTRTLMDPLASDLAGRGWHVVNIEYRRVGAGGGWPAPLVDAVTACQHLADMVRDGRLPGPLVLVGHSVGGQLALLAARSIGVDAVTGVVALAPVTDVVETLRAGLGDDAASPLLADLPGTREQAAVEASPLYSLPIGVPVVIVHGLDDRRVPHSHTDAFAAAAAAAGDRVRVVSPPSLEHRSAIDPAGEHWTTTVDALREWGGIRVPAS
ncbi:alpha/beta hydrolase [Microbacterium sp. HJ5]